MWILLLFLNASQWKAYKHGYFYNILERRTIYCSWAEGIQGVFEKLRQILFARKDGHWKVYLIK